jgi:propanol-preferring alcohol dehydrogenase
MQAMVLHKMGGPLTCEIVPQPIPEADELLVQVEACGVCRTDLHILKGDLPLPVIPQILGHQIVGKVIQMGKTVSNYTIGDRVGIPWLASTCGICSYCKEGRENLCDDALFTGYHKMGGFAEYTTCKAAYAIALPHNVEPTSLAPLLCAGLIGFRAYKKIKHSSSIGFYGFGSAAHILLQIAVAEGKKIFVFTRPSDIEGKKLALELGATWVGNSNELPPKKLDAALVFAPKGDCMTWALKALNKGGICVSAGIHMTDIPSFPYQDLFFEKTLTCVSHLTRDDAKDFFKTILKHPVSTTVHTYPLKDANQALIDLEEGNKKGSFVLQIQKNNVLNF